MTDIMHDWRNQRFIIPSADLTDGEMFVILTDISFWADHAEELVEWCKDRNCTTEGMIVVFKDEMSLTEFVLKWS